MKKIFTFLLFLLIISIAACSDSKKQQSIYSYTEVSKEASILKQDTIMADNDTLACKKAVQKFFISLKARNHVRAKMEEKGMTMIDTDDPASFNIYDENGKVLSPDLLSEKEIAEIAASVDATKLD